jgi:hypothetical protein
VRRTNETEKLYHADCVRCGQQLGPDNQAELVYDHIVPGYHGGSELRHEFICKRCVYPVVAAVFAKPPVPVVPWPVHAPVAAVPAPAPVVVPVPAPAPPKPAVYEPEAGWLLPEEPKPAPKPTAWKRFVNWFNE